jgi:hypothetical protein
MNHKAVCILLSFIALIDVTEAYCDPVDSAEAKKLALQFYRHIRSENSSEYGSKEFAFQVNTDIGREWQPPEIRNVIQKQSPGGACLYTIVFTNLDFVMVAGDHDSFPVLAYSTEHSYSQDSSPEFDWWVTTEYLEPMQGNLDKGKVNPQYRALWQRWCSGDFSRTEETGETGPLISSKWGQVRSNDFECPAYNSLIPQAAADCGCGRCSAGCVAVAMAQIMNFWKYPESGLSEDFDWCHMPDALYKYAASELRPDFETERLAIAALLKDCGETASLSYCSSGCATSSTLGHATHAFRNHYAYSNAMQHQYRWLTSNWKSRLRQSLDMGCPVLYGGQSSTSGHAFICDGYQQDDFFHFNWGWNGSFNAYYYINGKGDESEIDYDGFQEAVFFLYPQNSESSPCRRCQQQIVLSNRVADHNPYLQDIPYIEWTGLPATYNYLPGYPLPYPPSAEVAVQNDRLQLLYQPVDYGLVHLNGILLPDRISFSVIAYREVLIENMETFMGAEFSAEPAVCSEFSPFLRQFETPVDSAFLQGDDPGKILISPDPARDQISVNTEIPQSGRAVVEIVNSGGSLTYRKELLVERGTLVQEIDCSAFPLGLYVCTIRGPDWGRSGWFRMVR